MADVTLPTTSTMTTRALSCCRTRIMKASILFEDRCQAAVERWKNQLDSRAVISSSSNDEVDANGASETEGCISNKHQLVCWLIEWGRLLVMRYISPDAAALSASHSKAAMKGKELLVLACAKYQEVLDVPWTREAPTSTSTFVVYVDVWIAYTR